MSCIVFRAMLPAALATVILTDPDRVLYSFASAAEFIPRSWFAVPHPTEEEGSAFQPES